jgi:hypothetical protein
MLYTTYKKLIESNNDSTLELKQVYNEYNHTTIKHHKIIELPLRNPKEKL